MLLRAHSLDRRARAGLRPGATFRVHSVFERALNLVDGDDAIFGLVGPRGGNGPATLVLAALPPNGFRAAELGPGAGVDEAGRLVIGNDLAVDLAEARVWRRPELPARIEPSRVRANLARAAELAYRLRGGDGLGGLLPHWERLTAGPSGPGEPPPGLSLLLRAAWLGVAELLATYGRLATSPRVEAAARRLIGLGPGQTPSGDDLLAGFLVAQHRLRPGQAAIATLSTTCLQAAVSRTTDLGLARLRYAAEGELDERSELALVALLGGEPAEVEATTCELLRYGHSSGLDTLVGLVLGIGTWVWEMPRERESIRPRSLAPALARPLARPGRPTTLATRGMVASPNHLASQAGLRVLQDGGNAVDAAVATSAALAVVSPDKTSLGGDLFALVWDARSATVHALNASGRAAGRATVGFYAGRGLGQIPSRGPLAALTVPGAVDGWCELLERFGRRELGQVLGPAREYAELGCPVTASLAHWLVQDRDDLAAHPTTAAIFLDRAGRPHGLGDRLVQANLARSLRRLAEGGREVFYRGALGAEITAALDRAGSPLSADDFTAHASSWQAPISTTYRGQTAYQVGPNAQGFAALEILNILDGWDLHDFGEGTTAYYHHLVEATRQAFGDRDRYLCDPDFGDVPLDRLLSAQHADRLRAAIDPRAAGTAAPRPLGGDTVYLATADRDGNLVSLIHSLYWDFGSAFVAGETGIVLQNRGSFFSLDPEHVNCLAPGKRPFHTIIPAMLARDGRPWLAYGTMGGEGQPQTQTAVLTRIVDFDFDLQTAIEAPRWLLGRTWGAPSSALHLEERIPAAVIDELRALGHPVEVAPAWSEQLGHAQAVAIDAQRGTLLGAADPRGDGAAVGY